MVQSDQRRRVKELAGNVKRAVGYSSTFGILGYFLIPVLPATAAIVVGMAGGALVAKALNKKK